MNTLTLKDLSKQSYLFGECVNRSALLLHKHMAMTPVSPAFRATVNENLIAEIRNMLVPCALSWQYQQPYVNSRFISSVVSARLRSEEKALCQTTDKTPSD